MKKFLIITTGVLAIAGMLVLYQNMTGTKNLIPSLVQKPAGERSGEEPEAVSILVKNLQVPWALSFLPDGSMLVSEREGKLSRIKNGNTTQITQVPVEAVGESGLHGIAVDPSYESNNNIYLYYTYQSGSSGNTLNRVVRYRLVNDTLTEDKILVDQIPAASNHDGGRIKFGPDGFLYITTGDAQVPTRAQDRNSLSGKILRVDREGNPAPGNPFNTRIYSWGHRNPQGIAWDNSSQLWATEHGRSGALSGLDELNLIKSGGNYGWPEIEGNEQRSGMITPVLNSGSNDTWAPAGLAFYNGKLYFGGLRGQALYEYDISKKQLNTYFKNELGRIREVVLGPDNLLYITTSNRDGRGIPKTDDDKILVIDPNQLP